MNYACALCNTKRTAVVQQTLLKKKRKIALWIFFVSFNLNTNGAWGSSSRSDCMGTQKAHSSPPTPECVHEVFLSFRDEDTHDGFTKYLYTGLKRKGINTFRDDDKLERGKTIKPELLKAIEESRLAVVILSDDFASSTWCLDELAHIVKCNEDKGLQIFPVFYYVDPSEVRKQKTGNFGKALAKHEEDFKNEIGKVER